MPDARRDDAAGWRLLGVPYTSMAEPGGIARAIGVLRSERLAERLRGLGVADGGDLDLEAPSCRRGRSGLLNEAALERLFVATREAVGAARAEGLAPLLIGGDCPVLLGALAGLAQAGVDAPALVMADGHQDAWPPQRSPTGEGSDSELAIALGLAQAVPGSIGSTLPLVPAERVALLGPRDAGELADAGVPSLAGRVAFFADDEEVARRGGRDAMAAALDGLGGAEFWLHVDLDVLRTGEFAAVDYPQPGGIDWEELDALVAGALESGRCGGMSVVIYNPDLDADRAAARQVVEFVARALPHERRLTHPLCG